MYQILSFSALRAIARHEDIGFRHDLSERLSHLGISCPYNGAHITVRISHNFFAPGCHFLAYEFIERAAIDQLILELSAGRIGSLDQHEYAFFLFLTYIQERIHSVRAKIRIDRYEILIKRRIGLVPYLDPADMSCGISG